MINITAYYKGSEGAKYPLSKPCKVTASALIITDAVVVPPPIEPPVEPPVITKHIVEVIIDGIQVYRTELD